MRSIPWKFTNTVQPESTTAWLSSPAPHLEELELINLNSTLRRLLTPRPENSVNFEASLSWHYYTVTHAEPGPWRFSATGLPLLILLALDFITTNGALAGESDLPPFPLRHLKKFHCASLQSQHTVRLPQLLELLTGVAHCDRWHLLMLPRGRAVARSRLKAIPPVRS